MKPWKVIESLTETNSRLTKEEILTIEFDGDNVDLMRGLQITLDPLVTFGIKKVPKSKEVVNEDNLGFATFNSFLEKFKNRELTGNAARDAVEYMMSQTSANAWNFWYRRILVKDLKCGVSTTTVNKILKKLTKKNSYYGKYVIPTFKVQLATDASNSTKHFVGEKYIEVKLDGVRALAFCTKKNGNWEIDMMSRNGRRFSNFEKIENQLKAALEQFEDGMPVIFDGEVMSASFQDLMKQVQRKENVNTDDAIFHVFDYISQAEFFAGKSVFDEKTRRAELMQDFGNAFETLDNVEILGRELVNFDTAEGYNQFIAINKQAIQGGYEGVMLKDVDGYYDCKRATNWLKIKPFIEVTLMIKEVLSGTGRNADRMGTILCEGIDDGKMISVYCGGGYSDQDRDMFWENRTKVIGDLIEVRADGITQNQDGSYSLRFPRFKTFRGFEKGEKL